VKARLDGKPVAILILGPQVSRPEGGLVHVGHHGFAIIGHAPHTDRNWKERVAYLPVCGTCLREVSFLAETILPSIVSTLPFFFFHICESMTSRALLLCKQGRSRRASSLLSKGSARCRKSSTSEPRNQNR